MIKTKNYGAPKSTSEKIVHGIVFAIFSIVAFTYLYLIFWCFHSGMRTNSEIAHRPFGFGGYALKNYGEVFSEIKSGKTDFGNV